MIQKSNFISGIILFLPCLFFSCSQQEPPPLQLESFNKASFMKRAEAAFFSDSALRELWILRIEIYVKHRGNYKSKDLKYHFGKSDRNNLPSLNYNDFNDTMLSKKELEVIRDIKSYELFLKRLNNRDRQYYNSVKKIYRSSSKFDSTIVDFIDYTGDGKKELCITEISRKNDTVLVRQCVISGTDTIYNKTTPASFAPVKDLPFFDVYNNLKTALRLSPFKASLQSVSPDMKKHYEGKKAYQDYLNKFKGEILLSVTGESSGCSYFWYAPEKKFETLYCE